MRKLRPLAPVSPAHPPHPRDNEGMAEVTPHNELVIHTNGNLPAVGAKLPEFSVLG